MKNVGKKAVVGIATATMVLGFATGVGANSLLEKITAYKNHGINFQVDGQDWTPKDPSGNDLTAITYSGSTYLPVRSVGEAFDVGVNWNDSTQTVSLGETDKDLSIMDLKVVKDHYAVSKTVDSNVTVQNGVNYESGFHIKEINSAEKEFTLGPNGSYQHANFKVFDLGSEKGITVTFKDGDVTLKEVDVTANGKGVDVDINIGGVKELEIIFESKTLGSDSQAFITGTVN
ncbi:copper amine oxidase [Gracilibacillus oryzae]|uniref:Copper amine oxidase n=1 Tax=Gracilibacillus oryzae TaxID=1672701 RepID=A0A7C8GR54_9BACI|nr:stalk domain-containing protein [Gracilibacillus oryzae]KAB8127036.1 copper amine oxidase [Gracilibacillus oryzae]